MRGLRPRAGAQLEAERRCGARGRDLSGVPRAAGGDEARPLDRQAPGNRIRGYHLSRLYAPWANLQQMLEASDDPGLHGTREFYNSDLGEVFAEAGGGLSLDDLDRCRRQYELGHYQGQTCVMGVDVGKQLHVIIRQAPNVALVTQSRVSRRRPIPEAHIDRDTGKPPPGLYPELYEDQRPTARVKNMPARLWFAGTVRAFEALDALMARFHVAKCVIDAQPETREATRFAERHEGKVALARYDPASPHERGS